MTRKPAARLTSADLEKADACESGINWFNKRFPRGVGLRDVKRFAKELDEDDNDYAGRFLVYMGNYSRCFCKDCVFARDENVQLLIINGTKEWLIKKAQTS